MSTTARAILIVCIGLVLASLAGGVRAQEPARLVVKVTAEQANIRERPDIGSAMLQQVPGGTLLEADRKEGEWYLVRYTLEDGGVIAGWIHESLVSLVSGTPTRTTPPPTRTAPPPPVKRPVEQKTLRAPETGETAASTPTVGFSVSSGGNYLAGGDLNLGLKGIADYYGTVLGASPTPEPGSMHLTYILGAEVSFAVVPRFWLGLGVDFFRGEHMNLVEYEPSELSDVLEAKVHARAVPIRLSLTYYPAPGIYLKAGLGWYPAKTGYTYRFERAEDWVEWTGEATANGLGVGLAVGGEWELYPNVFVFAEGDVRFAKVSGFEGQNITRNSEGLAYTEDGTLWIFNVRASPDTTTPALFIRSNRPAEAGVEGAEPAAVDFSGASLRLGVRIRF